jgi:hypothetical protein
LLCPKKKQSLFWESLFSTKELWQTGMNTKPIKDNNNSNNNNFDDDTEEDVRMDIDSEETEPLSESELSELTNLITENNTNQQNFIANSVSIEHGLTEEMSEETIEFEQTELPRTEKITKKNTEKIDLKQIQNQKQKLITDYLTNSNMKTRKQKRGVGINYLFYSGNEFLNTKNTNQHSLVI